MRGRCLGESGRSGPHPTATQCSLSQILLSTTFQQGRAAGSQEGGAIGSLVGGWCWSGLGEGVVAPTLEP